MGFAHESHHGWLVMARWGVGRECGESLHSGNCFPGQEHGPLVLLIQGRSFVKEFEDLDVRRMKRGRVGVAEYGDELMTE